MKRKIELLFLLSFAFVPLHALSLEQALQKVADTPLVQAKKAQAVAFGKLYKAQEGENYPSVDLSFSGKYLKEKPVMYTKNSFPFLPPNIPPLQVQSQNQYQGTLRLTYPLFSGFAISSLIDTAKYKAKKAALEAEDTKRNLYLKTVGLYVEATIFSKLHHSQKRAYEAIEQSYKKAKAFFHLGLIAESQLYRLEAALHKSEAGMLQTKNSYESALAQLSALLHTKIETLSSLPKPTLLPFDRLVKMAFANRPDLQALRMMVKEQNAQVDLAKSTEYPSVVLFAQASQVGDSPQLNGDGFTNKDRSAVGFVVKYNLFSGLKTKNEVEASESAKLSAEAMLHAYEDKIKSELQVSYLHYKSLLSQQKAMQEELKSQESYESLVKGEFENQLADADKLSRAIAATSMARASLHSLEAKLYFNYAKLLLEVSNETFLQTFKGINND